MEKLRLIVECGNEISAPESFSELGDIIYELPMIDSYVIEIPKNRLDCLRRLPGVKTVSGCAAAAAFMNRAREAVRTGKSACTGAGISVAFIDTGVSAVNDFTLPKNRVLAFKDFVGGKTEPYDDNGHGTHVAGIAAGNGFASGGLYCGIAPGAGIVAVKALDSAGKGNAADMLAALQWTIHNRERYNIRVVNLSAGTSAASSWDPLTRGCEAAWAAGLVVVAAAGNNGPKPSGVTSPGVSRKIITVGASDDYRKANIWGTAQADFSSRGPTPDCVFKPDIVAPGASIISCGKDGGYVEMGGTSMAAPLVAGAVALQLSLMPGLTPDEVKTRIKACAVDLMLPRNQQGWGLLNIDRLLRGGLNV